MGKDYYAILGVAKGADDNELKKGKPSTSSTSQPQHDAKLSHNILGSLMWAILTRCV
jgi:hypothetical protein